MSEEVVGDVTTGVTWSDIYESPEVERSLRRLPRASSGPGRSSRG